MLKNRLKPAYFFRKNKIKKIRTKALKGAPQKRGDCIRILKISPRKPNSANRSIAKVWLCNKRRITVYIPGVGHTLQKHSTILVRGGRAQDLPGVHYKAIRGKFDLIRVYGKTVGHSKYGGRKIWRIKKR
jgi:small subunit ribosomal protein S12